MGIVMTILFVTVVIGTLSVVVLKRQNAQGNELLCVRETIITALLGLLVWVEAGYLCYLMLIQTEKVAFNSSEGINTYFSLIMSIMLGSGLILYAIVKRTLIYEDRVVHISMLGGIDTLLWEEIDEVRMTRSKRIMLMKKDGTHFTVGGENHAYKRFIKIASTKIRPESGEDILGGLINKYKI